MLAYFGKALVDAIKGDIDQKSVLYQSRQAVILSSKACCEILLSNNRTVFLWGAIYAIKKPNGQYYYIDMTSDKCILRELLENVRVEDIPLYLEGDFNGIYIITDKKAVLFADLHNRSEVFYAKKSDGWIVSSDLDAIIQSMDVPKYSQVCLCNLLTVYGYYAPKKQTIYEDIKRPGVGEYIEFHDGAIKLGQVEFTPIASRPFAERELEQYGDIFLDAVRIRASSQCNWVFLSSGWDSTSILAILVKLYGPSKVKAVIGQMRYSDRAGIINQFEIHRAKAFAEHYGVELNVIPFDLCTEDSIDYWKRLRLTLRRNHIYTTIAYNCSRLSDYILEHSDGRDAVFAGEFSDASHNLGFAQYATILEHPDIGFREYSDKMASYLFSPKFYQSVLDGNYKEDIIYNFFRQRLSHALFDDDSPLDIKERRFKFFASFFLRNRRVPFYSTYNSRLLTRKGADMLDNDIGQEYLGKAAQMATPQTLYSWMLHLYNSFYWQGSNVRSFGLGLNLGGRKLRFPFADTRMLHFLSEMPESWGRGLELRPTKYPLKWFLQNRLEYPIHLQSGPHSYLYDVNPQFSHSSELLFGSFLSNYLKELLSGHPFEAILDPSYFHMPYLNNLTSEYLKGTELTGHEANDLMFLVTLCLIGWY